MNTSSVIPFPQHDANRPTARERITPQSDEAESSTLGAMIMERDAIARGVETLTAEDFYRERHRKIFSAIVSLFDKGEPVDLITVVEELRRRGQLEEAGGAAYLTALIESCPSAANVESYAKVVAEKSILRQLVSAADQIAGLAYGDVQDVDQLVDQSEKKIFEIGSKRLNEGFLHIKPLLMTAYDQIERQFQRKGEATGITTGFSDLDDITSGLQPTDLIIVAARPSMGKTALCLNIAHHVAMKERLPVAIFSLEMSRDQLVQRLICSEAQINSRDLRRGFLQDSDWHRVTNAVNNLYQAQIFIDDSPSASTFEMRAKARRLMAEHGQLGLIVVDYLQLAHSSGRSENRVQEISEIARALKSMARELKVPLIALSQLSRAVEQREDKRPMLSDLRESGCVTGDTLVYLPDAGVYRPIAQLEHLSGFRVLAVNPQTWKLEPRRVEKAFRTGHKDVYRLTTQSGRAIRATANHKFLTIEGWKRLDELSAGTHLCLPRILPESGNTPTLTHAELALLGHLIGDGSTLEKRGSYYTSGDEDLAQLVARLATEIFGDDIKARLRQDLRGRYEVGLISNYHLARGKHNAVAEWLRRLGAWDRRSYEKTVPDAVFAQPADGIACFLRHLWATDGCLHLKKCHGSVTPLAYYASNSEDLARGVQSLLLRLSVQSTLRPVPQGDKGRLMWNVIITGGPNISRFLDTVGAVGARKEQIAAMLREHVAQTNANTNRDVIPRAVWRGLVVPAMQERGMTTRQMQSAIDTRYCGTALYKSHLSRERAARVARAVGSDELLHLAQGDVYWDQISAIEYDSEEDVYDLTVEGLHNFVAGDIVIHNSIEAEADVVAFIYRPSYYKNKTYKKDGQGNAPRDGMPDEVDPDEGMAEVIIGKQRNGPVGTVRLRFEPNFARFENLVQDSFGGYG
jgi:replicative DNA helicase